MANVYIDVPNCIGYESVSGGFEKSATFAMLRPHLKVGAQKWTAIITHRMFTTHHHYSKENQSIIRSDYEQKKSESSNPKSQKPSKQLWKDVPKGLSLENPILFWSTQPSTSHQLSMNGSKGNAVEKRKLTGFRASRVVPKSLELRSCHEVNLWSLQCPSCNPTESLFGFMSGSMGYITRGSRWDARITPFVLIGCHDSPCATQCSSANHDFLFFL